MKCITSAWLVSWCFKSSQPQRIISALKRTFIKRYIVERTDKEEISLEEKRSVVGRMYGLKYGLKGHKDRHGHKNRIKKRVGKIGWFMSKT